jgi:hypothetical protein
MTARAVAMQGIALVGVLLGGTVVAMHEQRKPMDAGELHVVIEQLASQAAETQVLLERHHAGDLTATFFTEHASQLAKQVDSTRDKLQRAAEQSIEPQRRSASDAALTLLNTLRAEATGVDRPTGERLDRLHDRLAHLADEVKAEAP